MPHGTGKKVRVLVIAQGDKIKEAEAAGADFVGVEYVAKIKEGWMDTDVIVATPDVMGSWRARQDPRAARADAEPEVGHRHDGRDESGERAEGGQNRVPRG